MTIIFVDIIFIVDKYNSLSIIGQPADPEIWKWIYYFFPENTFNTCSSSPAYLITFSVVGILFLLGKKFPLLTAEHHPFCAWDIFHVCHQLSTVKRVTISKIISLFMQYCPSELLLGTFYTNQQQSNACDNNSVITLGDSTNFQFGWGFS